MTTNPNVYECTFCSRTFVRESSYLNHRCKYMVRDEIMQSSLGQTAWLLYSDWLRKQKKLPPRNSQTFIKSKYFNAFVKYADFVRQLKITNDIFMDMMVKRDIPPTMWTHDAAYALYLQYLEKSLTPMQQVGLSIKTLMRLADSNECDICDVFTHIHPNELLQLIRERKLTPWLLLHSRCFGNMLRCADPEQRHLFEELIRPAYWRYQWSKQPKTVERIKQITKELNI